MEENYHINVTVEFPEFCNTPPALQQLIRSCTLGSPDQTEAECIHIIREGPRFFPYDGRGVIRDSAYSPAEAMDAAKALWSRRVREMEIYIEAKSRWIQGSASTEDETILGFPQRPKLSDVPAALKSEESKHPAI